MPTCDDATPNTPPLLAERALHLALGSDELRLSYRWLRYECDCPACGDSRPGLRSLHLHEVPDDIRPRGADWDAEGLLRVVWAPDGHVSRYSPAWLAAATLASRAGTRRAASPQLWDSRQALPEMPFAALDGSEQGLFEALRLLRDRGIVLLRGVPCEPGDTEALASLFGPLHETSYGRVFDLESRPGVFVAGTTSRAQTPHTDEPFRYTPPGFIFFHSIRAGADRGGTSLLVDGFAVAEDLRQAEPATFDLLSRIPVQFHRRHAGDAFFHAEAPIITRSFDGEVTGIRYNDRATAPLDLPPALLDSGMTAVAAFVRRLCDPRFQVRILLRPGDLLIFDNHRVLHGRTAFDPALAHRLLRSCHVDRDAVHSRLRTLAERYRPEEAAAPLPQGCGL